MRYYVVENVPGEKPEDEPLQYDKYSQAMNYLVEYNREISLTPIFENVTAIVNGSFMYTHKQSGRRYGVQIFSEDDYDG